MIILYGVFFKILRCLHFYKCILTLEATSSTSLMCLFFRCKICNEIIPTFAEKKLFSLQVAPWIRGVEPVRGGGRWSFPSEQAQKVQGFSRQASIF